jgi:hypothetical protein
VITALDVWARHGDPKADLSSLPDANSRAQLVRSMSTQLKKLCVIIDDVWDDAAVQTLMSAVPPGCPIVITTRDGDLAKALRCRIERIDALPEDEAVALLVNLLGPLNKHESAAKEIHQLTEGLPLALELIAGVADSPADLPALAKKLHNKPSLDILKLPGGEKREKSVEACLKLSYDKLDTEMQRRFRLLGVFAPTPFDREAIAAVWDETEADVVDNAVHFLTRRNLLTKIEESHEYRQHALLRAYAFALLNPHPATSATSASVSSHTAASPQKKTGEQLSMPSTKLIGAGNGCKPMRLIRSSITCLLFKVFSTHADAKSNYSHGLMLR